MCHRALALLATAMPLIGCFSDAASSPVPGSTGSDSAGTDTMSTTGTATTTGTETTESTSTTSTTTGSGSTTQGTTDSATSTTGAATSATGSTDSSSTGEPLPIVCEDGIVAPGELCFEDAELINSGDIGRSARLGDVDENGTVDLVYQNSDTLQVHLGDGNGGFGGILMGVTIFANEFELGHFNAGGDLDIITASMSSAVNVFYGAATATFAFHDGLPLTNPAYAIAVADIDGDNDDDAVVGTRAASAGTLHYVETVNGDPVEAGVTGSQPVYDIAFGEFSSDGELDIAYSTDGTFEGLSIRLGDGNVGFSAAIDVTIDGTDPRGVGVGDFDGDGNDDIVYAAHGSDMIGLLLGSGAGGFADAELHATGTGPISILVQDVTSDGVPDVLVGHDGEQSLMIFPGDGMGSLAAPQTYNLTTAVLSIGTGDANGDTVEDIALSGNDETVTVLLSTP